MNWRVFTLIGLFLGAALACAPARADELLVIGNASIEVTSLSVSEISSIYLLKTTAWPDGTRIVPVNREATSEARAIFTRQVLRVDTEALAAYWNEMHFKGRLPPLIQESDQAVLAFVQKVPGALGYIRASTPPVNVKVMGRLP